ncbi:MAG: choice-of-anchor Q domain-containing protein [Parcubacteria group bacterium]
MKKTKLLKLLTLTSCFLFLFCLKTASASAVTYYVCNSAATCNDGSSGWSTGNDSYSTTQAQNKTTPYSSIEKATEVVVAGDTVIVGKGTYTDTDSSGSVVHLAGKYGTAGNPITFKSEQKWGAIIDGQNTSYTIGIFPYYCTTGYSASNSNCNGDKGSYITIDGFEIVNSNGDGIISNWNGISGTYEIDQNVGHDNVYKNNKIHNAKISGISGGTKYGHGHTYDSNIIYHIGALPNGGHGIYTGGHDLSITNNIIYDVYPACTASCNQWYIHLRNPTLSGIYAPTSGLISNNTFGTGDHTGTVAGILLLKNIHDLTIQNNIFYQTGGATNRYAISCYAAEDFSNIIVRNNLRDSSTAAYHPDCNNFLTYISDSSNIQSDPLFTNATGDNYTLQAGSLARDNGISTNAPAADYLGVARPQGAAFDIGAYEYVSESDTTPPAAPSGLNLN